MRNKNSDKTIIVCCLICVDFKSFYILETQKNMLKTNFKVITLMDQECHYFQIFSLLHKGTRKETSETFGRFSLCLFSKNKTP